MKSCYLTTMVIAVLAAMMPAGAQETEGSDGNSITAAMDRAMNFVECRMLVRIEDRKVSGKNRVLEARVEYLKGTGTRMEFEAPARDKGKTVLMLGTSLWMSSPGVKKPVRLSGKEAFMGTAFTNDDVMNLDKSDDYDAVVVRSDAEGWDLVLTARNASVPYPRIEARIGKDFLPRRMVYFARSGKPSKDLRYDENRSYGGKIRPSVMTIVDLMNPGDSSTVTFLDIREEAVNRARLSAASLGN